MFYLGNFLKTIWDLKFRGISFLVLTLLLVLVGTYRLEWKSYLLKQVSHQSNPYFNALVKGDVNLSSIVRKLSKLPGIKKIDKVNTQKVESEITKSISGVDESIVKDIFSQKIQAIRIEINKDISKRGHDLIKEYLSRLAGESTVTLSEVKVPSRNYNGKKGIRTFLQKGGDWYLIMLAAFMWSFASYTLILHLRTRSDLIEKFQRKKQVAIKSYLCGVSIIVIPSFMVVFYQGKNLTFEILIVVCIFLLGALLNSKKINLRKI